MSYKTKLKIIFLIVALICLCSISNVHATPKRTVIVPAEVIKIDMLIPNPIIYNHNISRVSSFKIGDEILGCSINNSEYKKIEVVWIFKKNLYDMSDNIQINLKINRGGKNLIVATTREELINLDFRNLIEGVATLTCIDKETNEYVAIGHSISSEKSSIEFVSGQISNIDYFTVSKSQKNKVGRIDNISTLYKLGNITSNNSFGIKGILDSDARIDRSKEYEVASFKEIKLGSGHIIVQNPNRNMELVEIEITSIDSKRVDKDKSIKFKITDEKLLKNYGGVVQGMSGCPIIQNGKIIGAISHADSTEPSCGCGVYIKTMIN